MAGKDQISSYAQGEAQGSSYIYNYGTSPNTKAAMSQKVRILAPGYGGQGLGQVGVLSSFGPNWSRDVVEIRGIGFGDTIAELVPNVEGVVTCSFERAMLYLSTMFEAFGYAGGVSGPVRALKHHRWPFDVEEQRVFSTLADVDLGVDNYGLDGDGWTAGLKRQKFPTVTNPENQQWGVATAAGLGHTALITFFETCWMTSWSYSISKDDSLITESGECSVTDVHDAASTYGEFMATGNDPTVGQVGSRRFEQ